MARTKQFAIGAAAILILMPALVPAQSFTITDLGTFRGGSVSQGSAVNYWGDVAGYARFANYNAHGFLWSSSEGLRDLGAIPPESDFSVAQAVNIFGDVAGYSYLGGGLNDHAVVWNRGKIHDLGTLPGGSFSQANGINDFGDVAGYSDGGGQESHAVLWSKGRSVQDLGTLPWGYYSQGFAINRQGEVVGYSNVADGDSYAFWWTRSGGMRALPMLPGGGFSASANGINNLGQIAGGTESTAALLAVLWDTHPSSVESLGTLPGQGWSTAFAINDLGQVVGWSGFRAFLWSRAKGMQDLNNLIPGNSGWVLTAANSINTRGQITGEGTINGESHGFLLTPITGDQCVGCGQ